MQTTITLDTKTLTSKINTNNFLLQNTSELMLIGFVGMTLLFGVYIESNPTTFDNFILYVIFGFMAVISFGVVYSYYFQKKVIKDTFALIETSRVDNAQDGTPQDNL